jgi:hypothetical protein
VRFRAERRIGEIKRAMRAAGELHEGGRPAKTSVQTTEVSQGNQFEKIRLTDLGIDENLSRRAERLAEIEPDSFERLLAGWRAYQQKLADRVSLRLLKDNLTRQICGRTETQVPAGDPRMCCRKGSALTARPRVSDATRVRVPVAQNSIPARRCAIYNDGRR